MIFSVVIPVYNVKDYLPKCIDSVLAQDFEDYEVILIDDGSTDGESGAICDRYAAAHPERIRAIHKPNGGVGEARNVGIEAAQGEYLIFIDSDDYIAPNMFRVLADAVARFGSDIIGFGAALEANGVVVKELVDPLPADRTFTLADTPELMQTMPSPWSRIWRRSLFLDSGVRYPARIWYEDLCTSVKLLALAKSAAFVPDILYYYVDRTNSITRNTNTARNAELFTAFDNLLGWYRENGLFERYYNELSRLAVDHVLLAASVRVLRVDPESELLDPVSGLRAGTVPGLSGKPVPADALAQPQADPAPAAAAQIPHRADALRREGQARLSARTGGNYEIQCHHPGL